VFVRKSDGIDVLTLDMGKKSGHIVVKDGELYPADKKLLSLGNMGRIITIDPCDDGIDRRVVFNISASDPAPRAPITFPNDPAPHMEQPDLL